MIEINSGSIPVDIRASLNAHSDKNYTIKATHICSYAKKAHDVKYSNVYIHSVIDDYPDKSNLRAQRIIAEFLCVLYYIWNTYGIRNTKKVLDRVIESFPEPDKELKEYIENNVKKIYEELWRTPYTPDEEKGSHISPVPVLPGPVKTLQVKKNTRKVSK